MKKNQIIRAWRNADDFANLSAEERAALPASPAAAVDIDDDVLASIAGGCSYGTFCPTSAICTPCPPKQCY